MKTLTLTQEVFFDLSDLLKTNQIDDLVIDGFQEFETLREFLTEQKRKMEEIEKRLESQEEDKKYNGWTNYATWRVGLEVINDMSIEDFGFDVTFPTDESRSYGSENKKDFDLVDAYDLGQAMKSYVEEHIEETSDGLARDYALAFLSEVNWYELASHMIEEEKEEAKQ